MRYLLVLLSIWFGWSLGASSTAEGLDDFARLRQNFIAELENEEKAPDAATIRRILAEQRPDGSFASVDYRDTNMTYWRASAHFNRILLLARAVHRGQAPWRNNPQLIAAIGRGFDYWTEHRPEAPGWWYRNIGIPVLALRCMLLMGDQLPEDTLKKFSVVLDDPLPTWTLTAQNRHRVFSINIKRGIVYRDRDRLERSIPQLWQGVVVSPHGEGIKPDYSYHQHGAQQQFGNYGLEFMQVSCRWAAILRGTQFAAPPEKLALLQAFFWNGMGYTLYRDWMDISACGRQLIGNSPNSKFLAIRNHMAKLALALPAKEAAEITAFFQTPEQLSGSRYFYNSDYFIWRRPGQFFSVKMSSTRVWGSESVNRENLIGLYTGCGFSQYLTRGDEYRMIGAVWNWRQLPGITVPQDDRSLDSKGGLSINRSAGVGGIDDGRNGSAMFDFDAGDFRFRKSFFGFDEGIAVLISGIAATSPAPLITTVESAWAVPQQIVATTAAGTVTPSLGRHALKGVLDVRNGTTCYRFPDRPDLTLELAERRGNWEAIQPASRLPDVHGTVFTLQREYGVRPRLDSLEYHIVPVGVTPEWVRLAPENPQIHALYDPRRDLAMLHFFAPGEVRFPDGKKLAVDAPAVLLRRGDTLRLAEPTQQRRKITVTWNGKKIPVALPAQGAPVTIMLPTIR